MLLGQSQAFWAEGTFWADNLGESYSPPEPYPLENNQCDSGQ